jgi:two-component system NtrC family sensor kinase
MTETVLVLDDSLTVRMDLAEAFENAGFRTLPCGTLAEARASLIREPVSVILLDVQLPDGDGIELLAELRATPAGAAAVVLVLSAEAEVKDRIRGLTTGADDYVGKPYDKGYVLAKARQLLRGRRGLPDTGPQRILVVDDSPTFREHLREMLTAAGYAVITAATGEDALYAAAHHRPTAMIVDGVLPGIDGATVIRRLRLDAALRGIPCLLLTGSEDHGAELRALDAGADAFVRKEEDTEVIKAKLAAIVRRVHDAPVDTVSTLGARKILAVDDSPTYLHHLAPLLRAEGYDVVLAHSGEEALELLAVEHVDCIMLDLMMPGLGGNETCRRIKAAPVVRDIPLILLTAHDDRAAMLDGLGAGADDYISKASEAAVLKARVRAQLRRKQFEDENRKIREDLLRKELEAAESRAARALAETRAAMAEERAAMAEQLALANHELAAANVELASANHELEAFSASVSHDLRAPLRAIRMLTQAVLEDSSDTLAPGSRKDLDRVLAAARRMTELIDALLELARIGRTPLARTPVDVSELAGSVLDELHRRDADREVSSAIAPGLNVAADPRLVRVLFDNLLGNAWKFTSRTPAARIEVGAGPGSDTIFVRDNGAGFDPAHAARLFAPFKRLHSEAEFKGTGIGLATVRRIVERHGGQVWAEGAIGRGATFYFTLPQPP